MVLIFGWGAGEAQDLGEVAPAVCPNCHNHVFMHHIKSEKKVSLYFVPLIPYGSDEYLACPTCRHGLQLRPDQRAEVESMQSATSLYRRGRYPAETFGPRVERFWMALGVAPSGNQVVRAAPALPQGSASGERVAGHLSGAATTARGVAQRTAARSREAPHQRGPDRRGVRGSEAAPPRYLRAVEASGGSSGGPAGRAGR